MRTIESINNKGFRAILAEVEAEVLKLFGDKLRQMILFGSYARNEQDPESDIDIFILVDESEARLQEYRERIVDIMTDLSLKYDILISLTKAASEHFDKYFDLLPFFQNVYNEGVEIYGKKAA
ncbi:MAG: nucleotidyltransferase domain-containing protein [bacterium]|nr:nucleotidyltransferase domain-containing protein [bacterium]